MLQFKRILQHSVSDLHKMVELHPFYLYNMWFGFVLILYCQLFFVVVPFTSNTRLNTMFTSSLSMIAAFCTLAILRRFSLKFLCMILMVLGAFAFFLRKGKEEYPVLQMSFIILTNLVITGLVCMVLDCSSRIFKESVSKHSMDEENCTPVEIIEIELSTTTFPRIHNIITWLKKKNFNFTNSSKDLYANDLSHIRVILLNIGSSDATVLESVFPANVIIKQRVSSFYSLRHGREKMYSQLHDKLHCDSPAVLLFQIRTDQTGKLMREDKELMQYIVKREKQIFVDVLYVSFKRNMELDELLVVSEDIEKTLQVKSPLCMIFCQEDNNLKQRLGLYLERKLKNRVSTMADLYLSELKCQKEDLPSTEREEVFKAIIRELKNERPDNCDIHELEVLLERVKGVSAYGIEGNEVTIYVEEGKFINAIESYLDKNMSQNIHMKIQIWQKNIGLQKFLLRPGSKVGRSDDRYGTLGMFLKDQRGIIYLTTCAHVISEGYQAFDEDKSVIGKSVLSIDTADHFGRNDYLDLSIVKVEEAMSSECVFGLRNVQDKLVIGTITDESVIKHEHTKEFKVYKWGAKSGLTRGKYKGCIAKKNSSDKFDHNMHKIECESPHFFEEGDSGSVVCFEATDSPQFQNESVVYIFAAKLVSSEEHIEDLEHLYYCYHVNNVFDCKPEDVEQLEHCLHPTENIGSLYSGASIKN